MAFLPLKTIVRLLRSVRVSPTAIADLVRLARFPEGICGARTIAAALGLGLLDALRAGPKTLEELEGLGGLRQDRLRLVLDAGVHYSLFALRNGHIELTGFGRRLADKNDPIPASLGLYCIDNVGSGAFLARMRNGPLPGVGFYECLELANDEGVQRYGEYMAVTAAGPARTLAETWDLTGVHRLLDVGGGFGRVASTLTARHRGLEVTVIDLPEVQASAEEALRAMSAERVRFEPRTFDEAFPTGHDAVLFSRVLHDWGHDVVVQLLSRAHAALAPGGRLAIWEMLRERDLGNPGFVIMAQWAVARGLPGEIRSADQYRALLADAGFHDVEVRKPFEPVGWNSLITAVR